MTIYGKVSIVLILGAVVAVLAATTRHLGSSKRSNARPEARADTTAATLERIQTDLNRLSVAVRNDRLQAQHASASVAGADSAKVAAGDEGEEAPRLTSQERKAAEHERLKQREQSLISALRLQQRDEVWATETEQNIQSRVKELDPATFKTTVVRNVTCGQSICEARISHESMKEARAIAEAMARVPTIGSLFSMREDGPVAGSYETAIFFGKAGYRLPQ